MHKKSRLAESDRISLSIKAFKKIHRFKGAVLYFEPWFNNSDLVCELVCENFSKISKNWKKQEKIG
jgi:hypothetical protein